MWIAKQRYQQREEDAYGLQETWEDDLGRRWLRGTTRGRVNLDGEAGDWEAVGYLVTKGFDGWMVYRSRRTDIDLPPDDVTAAERAVEAVVPNL